MNRVEILTEDGDPPQWRDNLQNFALNVLRELNIDGTELSILLCSKEKIRELNRIYRGKDYPTDVLSFPQIDFQNQDTRDLNTRNSNPRENTLLGDIVIALDVVSANAKEFNANYEEEIRRVVTHGILHLIGMDHGEDSEKDKMINLQEKILRKLTEEKLF